MKTALLSAHDMSGLVEFAEELVALRFRLLATSGTAAVLTEASIAVTDVAFIVDEPVVDQRLVTLSPQIHSALLARDRPEDIAGLDEIGVPAIDLVYVNLPPLSGAYSVSEEDFLARIDSIDIGGPALIRSAAKGLRLVLCEPHHLREIIADLRDGDWKLLRVRRHYAAEAIRKVARYNDRFADSLEAPVFGLRGQ
jgi:phosphoribosylaminoimidazolecarboxamide formyltransferase/IMP cyclohydrolase